MIETLISDVDERNRLFNAVHTIESVKRKADWALKWMGTDEIKYQELFNVTVKNHYL